MLWNWERYKQTIKGYSESSKANIEKIEKIFEDIPDEKTRELKECEQYYSSESAKYEITVTYFNGVDNNIFAQNTRDLYKDEFITSVIKHSDKQCNRKNAEEIADKYYIFERGLTPGRPDLYEYTYDFGWYIAKRIFGYLKEYGAYPISENEENEIFIQERNKYLLDNFGTTLFVSHKETPHLADGGNAVYSIKNNDIELLKEKIFQIRNKKQLELLRQVKFTDNLYTEKECHNVEKAKKKDFINTIMKSCGEFITKTQANEIYKELYGTCGFEFVFYGTLVPKDRAALFLEAMSIGYTNENLDDELFEQYCIYIMDEADEITNEELKNCRNKAMMDNDESKTYYSKVRYYWDNFIPKTRERDVRLEYIEKDIDRGEYPVSRRILLLYAAKKLVELSRGKCSANRAVEIMEEEIDNYINNNYDFDSFVTKIAVNNNWVSPSILSMMDAC